MSTDFAANTYGRGPIAASASVAPRFLTRISWGAVFAGAAIAVVVGAGLNILGAGIGANLVDATAGDTPAASSIGIGAGIWMLVSHLIGLGFGAYAAARLSGTADRMDGILHGLAMWATATLVAGFLVGSAASSVVSTATSGIANMLGSTAQGLGNLTGAAAGEAADRTNTSTLQSVTQSAVDRARNALTASNAEPAAMSSDQRKAEIGRLAGQRVTDGTLSQPDRDRLVALVAAEAGMSPDEARARIEQVEQQAQQTVQQAEQQARQAADAAATAAATASYWVFALLVLGAIAAALGARAGTRHGPASDYAAR
ncbi:hypothetical protein QMO56_07125 [Roseomonas sp. E05]|uniref:hypothetical protein n=1 Tax=Roseomonas sp. E05 TaxID=3046310 RepID=UPI0024BA992E|nr:hypothetical protein [Roseomonas sp. E05]MDJ0387881.1 hypothetical protein [Roseomonas sp. E05]